MRSLNCDFSNEIYHRKYEKRDRKTTSHAENTIQHHRLKIKIMESCGGWQISQQINKGKLIKKVRSNLSHNLNKFFKIPNH